MEWGMRKWSNQDSILLIGLGLLVVGLGWGLKKPIPGTNKTEIIKISPTPGQMEETEIVTEISGEVVKPGVYKFRGSARYNDLLAAAGGLTDGADREWLAINVNRAAKLTDGSKLFIPKVGQKIEVMEEVVGVETGGKISLNRASGKMLEELSGIGPAMAGRIMDYRTKNGGFKNIEEVKLVDGIGEALYEKIKDRLVL